MISLIGIGNNNEGFRSIAWALEHPGCFAYGKWSPRKMLRRAIRHEREHTIHIRRLL